MTRKRTFTFRLACLAVLVSAALCIGGRAEASRSLLYLDDQEWARAVRASGVDPLKITNPLEATDEMRRVAKRVAGYGNNSQKLSELQAYIFDDKEYRFSYDPDTTLTAKEAFETRVGNCVSFTNLFISMARSLNIPVQAALIYRAGKAEIDDDLIIVNNHIVATFRMPSSSRIKVYDFYRYRRETLLGYELIDDIWNTGVYLNNMGARALRDGKNHEALFLFESCVLLAPKFVAAYGNLGVARRRTGDTHGAFEVYVHALRMNRYNTTIRSNLFRLLQMQAEEKLERTGWTEETIPSTADGYIVRGDLLLSGRDLKGARQMYRSAHDRDEHSAEPLIALARLELIRGKRQKAQRLVSQALKLDPENDEALFLNRLIKKKKGSSLQM